MSLFLRRNLHASDDKHALLAANLLRDLHLSCGVMVTDGDDVEMQLLRLFHDGSGRHIDIAARRENRVNVEVSAIFMKFRQGL